ncbi:MAG: hypothetical protein ABI128_02395 [Rhodanobacter sp.]
MPWLLFLLVGIAVAVVRFELIESSPIGQLCGSSHAPWWCELRTALVVGFLHQAYGMAALVGALWALFSRRLAVAWLAAALGILALQLYGAETGALALLIGSLRLLRLQADACNAPVQQHGRGQQQIQAQP